MMKALLIYIFISILNINVVSANIKSERFFNNFEEIMQYAGQNSIFIKNLESQYEIDRLDIGSQKEIYTSNIDIRYDKTRHRYPTTSFFEPQQKEKELYSIGLEQKLPFGSSSSIASNFENTENHQDSLYRYDRAFIEAELEIDLLRNILGRIDKSVLLKLKQQQKTKILTKQIAQNEFLFFLGNDVLLLMQQQDLILYQKQRCHDLDMLYKINKKKFAQKLIELQNYLLIKTKYNSCRASLEELQFNEKNLLRNILYKIGNGELKNNISFGQKIKWPDNLNKDPYDFDNFSNNQLKMAELAIDISYQEYLQAGFYKLPDLKLGFTFSNRSQSLAGIENSSIKDYKYPGHGINIAMKIPLGDQKAKLLYEKAKQELLLQRNKYLELKRTIDTNRLNTINEIKKYQILLSAKQEDIKLKETIFVEKKQDFIVGRISTDDIINTQNDLTDALQELVKIKFSFFYFQLKHLYQGDELYRRFR